MGAIGQVQVFSMRNAPIIGPKNETAIGISVALVVLGYPPD